MKAETLLKEFFRYVILNICGMVGRSDVWNGRCNKIFHLQGTKKYKNADKCFSNTIYIMSILAVIFMLTGIFFSERLTILLGADKDVFSMTKTYLQVILLFAPAFMTNDTLICFVRNDGNPQLSMIGMLMGSFSNIILDYIFIFPLNMGIFGAVLATGLASVISLFILSKHWITKQNRFHLVRTEPSFRLTGTIISLGAPSFITEMASGIVMIVFNTVILRLQGNIGVAAYGVFSVFFIKNDRCMVVFSNYGMFCHFSWHCIIYQIRKR